jgi:hypothetical protein
VTVPTGEMTRNTSSIRRRSSLGSASTVARRSGRVSSTQVTRPMPSRGFVDPARDHQADVVDDLVAGCTGRDEVPDRAVVGLVRARRRPGFGDALVDGVAELGLGDLGGFAELRVVVEVRDVAAHARHHATSAPKPWWPRPSTTASEAAATGWA